MDMRGLDPVQWALDRHDAASLRLTFRAEDRAAALAWQGELRAKLTELLGGFPEQRGPLNPTVLEVRDLPTHRRTKLVFESRPGLSVLAYLLVPAGSAAPVPTVLCVPGHGHGVDDIVGIERAGSREDYQREFAVQAVRRGLAVPALEPLGFGHRRDPAARERGAEASACEPAAGAALLLGETMIGWRVWDVMRALDQRIRCAYVSGYLNTFRSSVMSVAHCLDNYVPGILNWAEMYDVAGLIAPRPLFSEAGDRDPLFPVAAAEESFRRVRAVSR
jgi:hypothetical protein